MSGTSKCPRCGASISPDAPEGFCLLCLVREGAASRRRNPAPTPPEGFEDYEILGEAARGGMGVVYRARQISLNRPVALKMILAGQLATPDAVTRFRLEAQAAAKLDHPHIVPIYEVGEHDGQHYFTMKFVEGGSLAEARPRFCVRSVIKESREVIRQRQRAVASLLAKVADALAYAHAHGVLHRDLKPKNILLDRGDEPLLTDFGLAKLTADPSSLTLSTGALGSPSYMAPEQAAGKISQVTTAADVYGLGAVLYELLTGRPPFVAESAVATMRKVVDEEAQPVLKLMPAVHPDLATICHRCLEKEPAARYASAAEVAQELQRFVRGEPIRARPLTAPEAMWRWMQRRPLTASLLGALALVFVLGFVGVTWQWRQAEKARRGEARALEKATAMVVDLYTSSGLTAAKEEDTTRAALWFAQAAATAGADPVAREAGLARWSAWRGDSITAVRAFESGIGPVSAISWSPAQDAIILSAAKKLEAAVWDVKSEKRWLPETAMSRAAWLRHARRVVFADGKFVRLLDYPAGAEIRRVACESPVQCLAVCEEDQWIAVGTAAPFLWNATDGRTAPLPADAGPPVGIEFSRDGRHVLVTGRQLRGVCDLVSPEKFLFPPLESLSSTAQGFLGDGNLFITHTFTNELLVLKSDTGAVVERYKCRSDQRESAQGISPDGRFIGRFSAGVMERPRGARSFPRHANRFEALDFSRDSSLLATASADDTVRLWQLPAGGSGRVIGWHQEGAYAVSISPDSGLVASAQYGGNIVRLWRVTNAPAGRSISGYPNSRVRLSPDGQVLVPSGRPDFDTRLRRTLAYAVDTAEPIGPEIVPGGEIMDAQFSPDGHWLALVCSTTTRRGIAGAFGSGTLQLWDFRAGRRRGDEITFPFEPRAVAVHPGGQKIAVYGARRTLVEVDVRSGQFRQLHSNPPGTNSVDHANANCRYSPDGRLLVAWGMEQPPVVWDGSTEKIATPPAWEQSRVMDIDFHGGVMGSGSMESVMEFLTVPDGRSVAPRIKDANWIFMARFSADGRFFLTGGRGRIGHVWNWRAGKLHCPALQHDGEIFGGTFIPGTEWVVTAGLDQVIRFWDRRTGLPLRTPLKNSGKIMNLTTTPDGRTLICDTKEGGDIRIYDIATILPKAGLPTEDALLLAEIDAAAEIHNGSIEPLGPEAWLRKWREFRAKHPDWHRW